MKKSKMLFMLTVLGILLLAAFFLIQQTMGDGNTITLPGYITDSGTGDTDHNTEDLNVITIDPNTVQAAIATLSRPLSYHRTQTIELFWDGGSSVTTSHVAVRNGLMRVDMIYPDGTVCHTLSGNDLCAVWYDEDRTWVTLRADRYSDDALQHIPSYESVLELPVERIIQAEYRLLGDVYCIFVLTSEDEEGYAESYFISVQSGLLYFAERTHYGEMIYRFSAVEPGSNAPDDSLFLLPDGSPFTP